MLEHHPWFEVAWLAASDRSEGRPYSEAARWRLKTAIPANVARMTVAAAKPEGAPKIIFAALDSSIARELEPQFAAAGCAVVSNSSALRMQADVPLVIPEVNGDHIQLIETQSWRRKSGGFAVTNPNCSAIGLVLALAPLHRRFTLETVMAVTMQAVSGAGYPGVASLDILGNVVPYIANEEEKMEAGGQRRRISGRGFARYSRQRRPLHRQRRRKDGRGDAKVTGDAERFSCRPRSFCHERAMQSRRGGRRPYRVGFDSTETESEAGGDHRGLE